RPRAPRADRSGGTPVTSAMRRAAIGLLLAGAACTASAPDATAQTVSHQGFVEGAAIGYPEMAPPDLARGVGDVLVRQEVISRPTKWLQIAAAVDLRASSHDEVESGWRFDLDDRTMRRPRVALR